MSEDRQAPAREFWFSPALEFGAPVGDYGDPPGEDSTTSESGLIEVVNGEPFVQRHFTSWWLLPEMPEDAVRLVDSERALAALAAAARIVEMYRHLNMDTKEDRELHRRVIETADRSVAAHARALGFKPEKLADPPDA